MHQTCLRNSISFGHRLAENTRLQSDGDSADARRRGAAPVRPRLHEGRVHRHTHTGLMPHIDASNLSSQLHLLRSSTRRKHRTPVRRRQRRRETKRRGARSSSTARGPSSSPHPHRFDTAHRWIKPVFATHFLRSSFRRERRAPTRRRQRRRERTSDNANRQRRPMTRAQPEDCILPGKGSLQALFHRCQVY